MRVIDSPLSLGLPKPETAEDQRDATTIAGMRRAIMGGARNSRLIRQCLEIAERQLLGREEIYVLLAYEALLRLEELHRACESCKTSSKHTALSVGRDRL
jgi:hypothetical protein